MKAPVRESQRDSVLQPRVGESASLPWVMRLNFPQPQRGCVLPRASIRRNRVAVGNECGSFTQGSSPLATLGWRPLPRWGKPADKVRHDLYGLVPEEIQLVEGGQ